MDRDTACQFVKNWILFDFSGTRRFGYQNWVARFSINSGSFLPVIGLKNEDYCDWNVGVKSERLHKETRKIRFFMQVHAEICTENQRGTYVLEDWTSQNFFCPRTTGVLYFWYVLQSTCTLPGINPSLHRGEKGHRRSDDLSGEKTQNSNIIYAIFDFCGSFARLINTIKSMITFIKVVLFCFYLQFEWYFCLLGRLQLPWRTWSGIIIKKFRATFGRKFTNWIDCFVSGTEREK